MHAEICSISSSLPPLPRILSLWCRWSETTNSHYETGSELTHSGHRNTTVNMYVKGRFVVFKITFFPRSMTTNLAYNSGSILTMISAILPSSLMYTSSSMSTCMNAPEISTRATSLFSLASITHVNSSDSMATVGERHHYVVCCLPDISCL